MIADIEAVLKTLDLKPTGRYVNHFYVITLENSDEYARVYTKLDKNAINTGFPSIESNTNNNTTRIVNYFELTQDHIDYHIFLFADFEEDTYYVKIKEA